jgi:hypothetical protein
MRRALVAALVGIATLLPVTSAFGIQESPQGLLTSPTRAVAGAPIFVRSITPCPVTGRYQLVRVGISPQSEPNNLAYIESTDADLRADGSWEVTLSAPVDMPRGITKSYDIHAQCIVNEADYDAPARDSSASTETTLPPEFSIFRYVHRRLYVTGFGASDVAEGAGPSGTSTTTTSTTSTTTLENPDATTTTLPTPTTLSAQSVVTTTAPERDVKAHTEAVRRELAARERSTSQISLASATAAATTPVSAPVDGGIPWWAFALATMLAVGAVVGYGVKRQSVLERQ